jgi:pyrroloquinoline quinone (PQQ) biosynthesis protein C
VLQGVGQQGVEPGPATRRLVMHIPVLAVHTLPAQHQGESEQLLQILAKLPSMSVKDLKRQARSLGVDEERIESLDDLEDVKVGSIALVEEAIRAQLEAGAAAWALEQAKADAALRAQLADVSVKLLKRQARGLGVSAQAIEDLDDADDVKQAAIEMVVQASRAL